MAEEPRVPSAGRARPVVRLLLATAVLYLLLIQPNHPGAMTWGALAMFPLELPVLVLALVALPLWAAVLLRLVVVPSLLVIATLKLADYGTFVAYGRPFNLLADAHLIGAAWMLGSGSIGVPMAVLAVLLGLGVLALVATTLWWSTGVWAGMRLGAGPRVAAALLLLPTAAAAVGEAGQALRAWNLPVQPPGAAFTARVGYERVVFYRAALADLEEFRRKAARDPFARLPAGQLLDRIGDTDVLLVYVESYGRSSFLNQLYSPTHTATLAQAQRDLAARGLAMRSAFLTAPMVGGQSWLAHATVASGLWVDNQRRYSTLLGSPRRTLFHLARAAGFSTHAVMPAIVMDWPEAAYFGFDGVHPAAALGYRGERFNWVTMPDQFTMTALDRLLRQGTPGTDRAPVFVQVALISSHAPWVPVPDMLPWSAIGDGTEFNEMALRDDPPEVVWRDHDRVRDQFRKAVDYALQVVAGYAALHAGADAPLMIVMGDHEPAPFVSQTDSFDVPVHIIGPPGLVAMIDDWGWSDGMLPDAGAPVWRMDAFRDRFFAAFSSAEIEVSGANSWVGR